MLTLHPVKVYGGRAVAFAVPLGAPVDDAIGHLTSGSSQAAIPFNEPGGISVFNLWQGNGESGPQPASGRIGSGTFAGHAWSATVYQGPWGVCVIAGGGGTRAIDPPAGHRRRPGHGGLVLDGRGTPAVAVGSAAPRVVRVVVTQPGGKTTQVPLVTVGSGKFFAFPMNPATPGLEVDRVRRLGRRRRILLGDALEDPIKRKSRLGMEATRSERIATATRLTEFPAAAPQRPARRSTRTRLALRQFVTRNRTLTDIATELGTSNTNITHRLRALGIPFRGHAGRHRAASPPA